MRADGMGVVTSLAAEVGQVVAQGQTIMKVASTNALDIVVSIPEQDLEEIRTAERTVFTLWANPDKSGPENFHIAHLREVAPGADPATRTYTAKFTISNPPDLIRIGMSATLIIEQRARRPVAELPLSALFQDEGQPAFWVLDPATNSLVLKPVTIERYSHDSVLIADGVEAGDRVVTAGVHKLHAGQRIRPFEDQGS
jgi:RND family efflux transporter MFP subunit